MTPPMTHPRTAHDPVTGELRAPRRGGFGRVQRTPEEEAEAARVRAERAELRRAEVTALRALDPACEVEGDPPVVWRPVVRMGGDPAGKLLDLPRVSGRGKPGSSLVLAARYYDGCGPNGGEAHHHVTLHVTFRDRDGHRRRTVGAQIHRSELRAVAAALVSHADALDAADTAGQP